MLDKILVVDADASVEKTMTEMRKKKAATCVVVDEDGRLLGYLDMKVILKNLLPVSLNVSAAGGAFGGMVIGAAPGIAKRLRKVKPLEVHHIMERNFHAVSPNTPVWEGVQLLVEHGSPIFVLEEKTQNFIGVMDEASSIAELERIQDEED